MEVNVDMGKLLILSVVNCSSPHMIHDDILEQDLPAPSFAERPPYDAELMTIDEYLIEKRDSSYLVRIPDDRLSGQGILAGDLAVVERGREAKAGDFVLARFGGGSGAFSVAQYGESASMQVEAVVTGLVRSYRHE